MDNPLQRFMVAIFSYLINLIPVVKANNRVSEDTLRLVHVIFRHGERTPVLSFPKAPHSAETYQPYGLGNLTDKGKETVFQIGRTLHKRYKEFLGNTYIPGILNATCTEVHRTLISLKYVLSGLYLPESFKKAQEVDINSNEIPITISKFKQDHTLAPPFFYCPNYIKAYEDYLTSPDGSNIQQKYAELFQHLSEHTGLSVKTTLQVYGIYDTIRIQEEWGFKLSEWTAPIYPKALTESSIDYQASAAATPKLARLSGGYLLKKIIDDSHSKIENKLDDVKLFLYSAHDVTVANLLAAMKVFTPPHIPPCGAYILVELHEINNVFGIKIYYQNYSGAEPKLLTIPGSEDFCPLEKFVQIVSEHIPTEQNKCNH